MRYIDGSQTAQDTAWVTLRARLSGPVNSQLNTKMPTVSVQNRGQSQDTLGYNIGSPHTCERARPYTPPETRIKRNYLDPMLPKIHLPNLGRLSPPKA